MDVHICTHPLICYTYFSFFRSLANEVKILAEFNNREKKIGLLSSKSSRWMRVIPGG